jgi:hypothetical protein
VSNEANKMTGLDFQERLESSVGPMAVLLMEKILYKAIQSDAQAMTGQEMKFVQFIIERTYGAATRKIEHSRASDDEIVADKLGTLDAATLRLIAGTNAPKTVEDDS